jgi:sigma-B regulation protein RsbU (phosphoserine phosphatase)
MAEDHLRTSNQQLEAINTRMKTALDSAANIQKSLLPTEAPNTETIDFAWRLLPCDELAGDSLNVVRLDETHIGLYILDVSGHGVPAALRSVTLAYLLTPETSRSVILTASKRKNSRPTMTPPARVAEQLNRDFPFDDRSYQFFTMIYGILDTQTYEFRYVCAGHPYPLLVPQSGKPIFHETGQLPIGVLPNTKYHESNLQMNSGDCLILYSDGVTEAQNNSDQQFGAEGLVKTIDKCREKTTERKVDEVIEAVKIWRGSSKIEDDVSVLAVGISED